MNTEIFQKLQNDFAGIKEVSAKDIVENIKISGTSDDDADGYFQLSSPLNFKSLEQPVAGTFTTTSGWYRGFNFIESKTRTKIWIS